MDASEKSDSIELLVRQLIAKVDASQSLIDELSLRLESQVIENKKLLEKMQNELEHYFLLSQRQFEIIRANEELQAKSAMLLASFVE